MACSCAHPAHEHRAISRARGPAARTQRALKLATAALAATGLPPVGVREAEAGAPAITQLSTVMVPTCGSDGARQSRVQQPQQLGAPTVDATECGCWGSSSRSIRTDDPHFCLDRDIAMGAGYVSATSEVVVVSADRALALPPTRPRRALRNNVLKMLHLRRFCSTLACTMPPMVLDHGPRGYYRGGLKGP